MTTCSAAIKAWAEENKEAPEEAKIVRLYAQMPPISKLDNKLNDLKNCVHICNKMGRAEGKVLRRSIGRLHWQVNCSGVRCLT